MSVSIIEAARDKHLLGAGLGIADPWFNWFCFLKSMFGLSMGPIEREVYRQCTGRKLRNKMRIEEGYVIVGRRAGKSRMLALVATYLACFFDYTPFLSVGEEGVVMIVAQDRRAARTIFNYIIGFLQASPFLRNRIVGKPTTSSVTLVNRIRIEIHTASFRAVRSYTVVAALFDEAAFWRSDESANPDVEILNAVQPSLSTIPGSMLLVASSPFAKRGIVYDAMKDYFGKDGADPLVWNAETVFMNPRMPEERVARAYEKDPGRAKTEYGAKFREDHEMPIPPELVDACTVKGRQEVPYEKDLSYLGFVDPSGGSQDRFTAAVGHLDARTGIMVLDAVRAYTPPFSPDKVTGEISEFLKSYKLKWAWGDAYAGEWPREKFSEYGISYELCGKTKSTLYGELIPLLRSHRVELLDLPAIESELSSIERRPSRTGTIAYDHPPKLHDDVANVVAGVCVMGQDLIPNYRPGDAKIGKPLESSQSDAFASEFGQDQEYPYGEPI